MTKHISLIKAAHLFVFALVLARPVALWNDVSAPLRIVTAGLVVTVVAVRRAPCAVRRAPGAVRLAPGAAAALGAVRRGRTWPACCARVRDARHRLST